MIKEVIVVEGKDDITAVKAALECEVIATNGFGYKKELVETLRALADRRGIIILTDPDYEGERIRRDLSSKIKNAKHAFLPKGKAIKKGDIGVENASPEDIALAIKKAHPQMVDRSTVFTHEDLVDTGLVGGEASRQRRERLGEILGIGYANGKQLLNRLNSFGVSREEFIEALKEMDNDGK